MEQTGSMTKNDKNLPDLSPTPPELLQTLSEDVITKSIGEFGRWQLWITFWLFLLKFPIAWHQLCIVFLVAPIKYHCENSTLAACDPLCTKREFDRSEFTETIVSEWDLVCDRVWLANLSQTVVMLGILIGNSVFGVLSDKFGRRIILVTAVLLQAITGPIAAVATWYELFVIARFLVALSTGGTMITSFVLLMEIIGKKHRTVVCVLYQLPFSFGHATLPLFAYFLRNWHHFYLALSVPSVLLLCLWCILPESPRWLITVGKPEEAIAILEKIARFNRMPYSSIRENVMSSPEFHKSSTNKGHIFHLFRTKNLRNRTLISCYNWFVCGFCFFGVAQYMGTIGTNVFLNVILLAIIQIPGTILILFAMEKWGRKVSTIASSIMGSVALLIIAFIPKTLKWEIAISGMLGIFGMWMCFPTSYQFSGELYPTVLRNTGVGLCSTIARVGSMIAPFVTQLNMVYEWLPPVLFAVAPLVGAFLTIFLPETMGCKLPDTVEEAENFKGRCEKEKSRPV